MYPPLLSAAPAHAPTSADAQGVTPLHLAARLYEPAAVERLMEKGANVKVKDNVRARPPPRKRRANPTQPPSRRLRKHRAPRP
eukprot:scaffold5239_cov112-Isochrysis_galbana.AAC.1